MEENNLKQVFEFLSLSRKTSALEKTTKWKIPEITTSSLVQKEKYHQLIKTFRQITLIVNELFITNVYKVGKNHDNYSEQILMQILQKLPPIIDKFKNSLSYILLFLKELEDSKHICSSNPNLSLLIDKFAIATTSLAIQIIGFVSGVSSLIIRLSVTYQTHQLTSIHNALQNYENDKSYENFTLFYEKADEIYKEFSLIATEKIIHCRKPTLEEKEHFVLIFKQIRIIIEELEYFLEIVLSPNSTMISQPSNSYWNNYCNIF